MYNTPFFAKGNVLIKTLSSLSALLLLAGCDNTHKAPTASKVSEITANTSVSADAPAAAPAPSAVGTAPEPAEAQEAEVSPAILFQRCAACHGNHAEKSALNQSAVIGEWDSKHIAATIYGYQDGTYGAAMKTLMQNQVKDLSRNQVEALSEYIANLYVKTH